MKKTAFIVYDNYLTPDGAEMSVGGIQTYITNLIPLLHEAGYCIHLYQRSIQNFETIKDDVLITGVAVKGKKKKFVKYLKHILPSIIDEESDLLIFGCETLAFESKKYRSIAIQHGIYWDIPFKWADNKLKYFAVFVHKSIKAWKTIKRVSKVRQLISVDYNFINWYRALSAYPLMKLNVVTNFTQLPPNNPAKPIDKVNVIFARRFFEYRGTRIFAEAIKSILNCHCDVSVTIAGAGPDEKYLQNEFAGYQQVSFIKYSSDESLAIHCDKHIAVVPTLGSEGTSLSLLEAMASGCAVICTNVGGMTNIILDHYNGLMINPDVEELREAMQTLIDDKVLRERLSKRAFEVASNSFSLSKWQDSWRKIIFEAGNNN